MLFTEKGVDALVIDAKVFCTLQKMVASLNTSLFRSGIKLTSHDLLENSRSIISIPRSEGDYFKWASKLPDKHGYSFDKRVHFWADSKRGLPGVLFLDKNNEVVLPLGVSEGYITCVTSTNVRDFRVQDVMPIFPRAIMGKVEDRIIAIFTKAIEYRDQLVAKYNKRGETKPKHAVPESWSTVTGWRHDSVNDNITEAELKQEKNSINKEKEDMSKTKQVANGMLNVNKEALKQVGYLNAGRASNKLIKESVRPLLNLMFKPTFMQKVAMKLFKIENPVDVALKSGLSDLACAQLAQALIELKGTENEYVRQVTQAGITQAGYELSKAIPFEDTVDKVVAHLESGAKEIADKIGKK